MATAALLLTLTLQAGLDEPAPQISGIVPRLTMRNDEGECGVGAVVPFAERL